MKKRTWRFLWICLAGILIFYLWALLILYRKSFFSSATRTWMGMKNYRDVLGNQAFWMAMKNTCFFLVVSILVLLLLSLFVARILLKNSIVNSIVKKGLLILRICHKGGKSGWGRCGQIVFLHSASTNEKAIFVHIAFCDHEWV